LSSLGAVSDSQTTGKQGISVRLIKKDSVMAFSIMLSFSFMRFCLLGNIPQIPKERTSSVRLRDGTSLIFYYGAKLMQEKSSRDGEVKPYIIGKL